MNKARLTFIGAAGDEDLSLGVEAPAEICLVMILDSLAEAKSTLRVGIVIRGHGLQSFFGRFSDPGRRGKVHIPLTEIDAIRWKIRGTATDKTQ